MKHEMTTCPTCGKAMAKCADERLLPESTRAINRAYGWDWDGRQCHGCWLEETKHDQKA